MSKNRSIIYSLPIVAFQKLLKEEGIARTWYSLLRTHVTALDNKALTYILKHKHFKGTNELPSDILTGLSIGEISVLYEYSLAYTNRDSRKQEGQYFTPDDVAQVLAKRAATFPKDKVWVDPCSGVGNLAYWLAANQPAPETFVKENLLLVDRDPLALFVARVLFAVHFQKRESRLFEKIEKNFVVADFLSNKKLPHYDYAILNPPYVLTSPDTHFDTATAKDMYAYFLERVLKSTTGFVSITPQTFTNGQKFCPLRKLLLQYRGSLSVYCFDNVPDNIFRGIKFGSKNTNTVNSTRAGIIVACPSKETSFAITPLLRWSVAKRHALFSVLDTFLTSITPEAAIFPKIQKELLPLYRQLSKRKKTLGALVTQKATAISLIIPSTPRYFISALKTPVARASMKILYFTTKEDRDQAYLLLNSSYMYWWWRVNDGGMTISEKTLLSLPIPGKVTLDKALVRRLERSEQSNRVVKRNAGMNAENVKHDVDLVFSLNKHLFPRYASALGALHRNSVL